MAGTNWETVKQDCNSCRKSVEFRVAHKSVQFKNGLNWTNVLKSASIVICPHCGATIWISQTILSNL